MAETSQKEFTSTGTLPTLPVKVPDKGITDTVLLSEQEAQLAARILSNPSYFPETFKSWIVQYMSLNGEQIPRSQIQGLSQFTMNVAENVNTGESTTSTTYTDLATAGPTITGLSDGQYLVLFGAAIFESTAAAVAMMNVQQNSTDLVEGATDDDQAAFTGTTTYVSCSSFFVADLRNNNNNTLTAKYRVNLASTGTFFYRRLAALKIGN